jgi:predicted nucleic acid-binding protein
MSPERATYVDSTALVKLAVHEPESAALRRLLARRRTLVSSALARTEVVRALLPFGPDAVRRGKDVLARVDQLRTVGSSTRRGFWRRPIFGRWTSSTSRARSSWDPTCGGS